MDIRTPQPLPKGLAFGGAPVEGLRGAQDGFKGPGRTVEDSPHPIRNTRNVAAETLGNQCFDQGAGTWGIGTVALFSHRGRCQSSSSPFIDVEEVWQHPAGDCRDVVPFRPCAGEVAERRCCHQFDHDPPSPCLHLMLVIAVSGSGLVENGGQHV